MSLIVSSFDTQAPKIIARLLHLFNSMIPGHFQDDFFIRIQSETEIEVVFKEARKKNALIRKSFCQVM